MLYLNLEWLPLHHLPDRKDPAIHRILLFYGNLERAFKLDSAEKQVAHVRVYADRVV